MNNNLFYKKNYLNNILNNYNKNILSIIKNK